MATPVVSLPVPAVVGIAIIGFNRPGTGRPWPIGCVDVSQEIRRIGGIEIGRLGCVHAGAASDRDITVKLPILRKPDGLLERDVRGLDANPVEEDGVNACMAQRLKRYRHRLTLRQVGIGYNHHAAGTQFFHIVPHLAGHAGAVLDAGRIHGESGLESHDSPSLEFSSNPLMPSLNTQSRVKSPWAISCSRLRSQKSNRDDLGFSQAPSPLGDTISAYISYTLDIYTL